MSESAARDDFLETLPFRGRRLVYRLESFGDIVVGFSISQLALQLGSPDTTADLISHPIRYALFFATFAIIAVLWLRFHRMLTMGFAPGRVDLICAFAYLAFTALLPYALSTNARLAQNYQGARYGLAAYTICLLGSSIAAFVLSYRSTRRARGILNDVDMQRLLQRTWIECGCLCIYSVVLLNDFLFGASYGSLAFLTIPLMVRVVRMRFKARGWDAVHVGVPDRPGA